MATRKRDYVIQKFELSNSLYVWSDVRPEKFATIHGVISSEQERKFVVIRADPRYDVSDVAEDVKHIIQRHIQDQSTFETSVYETLDVEMYKVFRRKDFKLLSANSMIMTPITYTPEQWNYPIIPNSGIFVFPHLEDAKSFITMSMMRYDNHEIWRVWARDVRSAPRYIAISRESDIRSLWAGESFSRISTQDAPKGTLVASAVYPIEPVNMEDNR